MNVLKRSLLHASKLRADDPNSEVTLIYKEVFFCGASIPVLNFWQNRPSLFLLRSTLPLQMLIRFNCLCLED